MQESVEKTRIVVTGGVNTMMESNVAKLMSSGVDTALSTSESLVERYLPALEESQGMGALFTSHNNKVTWLCFTSV